MLGKDIFRDIIDDLRSGEQLKQQLNWQELRVMEMVDISPLSKG